MQWQINTTDNKVKIRGLLIILTLILVILSVWIKQPFIFMFAGMILLLIFLGLIYDRNIAKGLIIENPKRTLRLTEGEEATIEIVLKNKSFLPYFNGTFEMQTNQKIAGTNKEIAAERMRRISFRVPFVLKGKSSVKLAIPIKAMERGVSGVSNVGIVFPHLLNFEAIHLTYLQKYQTEIIIYPTPLPVHGMESFKQMTFGNQATLLSPFEDLLHPLGTRDYIPSDSFSRVHWKASAKRNKLQTKIYERNRNISWTIFVNISLTSQIGNRYTSGDLESIISKAAFLCQSITEQGYPFSIYINLKQYGNKPYHVELNQGNNQLKKVWEMLARVDGVTSNIMKMEEVLHPATTKMADSNLIVFVGEITSASELLIRKWNTQGKRCYFIAGSEESNTLQQIPK